MNTPQQNINNQPATSPAPAPTPAPVPMPTNKKPGKSKLVLIIVIALVIIAILAVGVYWLIVGMGQSSAKSTANNFMSAMTSNNATKALDYSANPNEDTKLFYQSSAVALKGTYTFKQISNKDGAYYVLYTVDGGGNKTARVKVIKSSNKYLVDGFYYSSGELTTDPSSTGTSQASSSSANNQDVSQSGNQSTSQQEAQKLTQDCEIARSKIDSANSPQDRITAEQEYIKLRCR